MPMTPSNFNDGADICPLAVTQCWECHDTYVNSADGLCLPCRKEIERQKWQAIIAEDEARSDERARSGASKPCSTFQGDDWTDRSEEL